MTRQSDVSEKVVNFLSNRKNWLLILAAGLLIVLFPFILRGFSRQGAPDIREDQIKIQKGAQIVIVSEDGTVEYISSDGVYYDSWDSQTVSSFFSTMRTLVKQYMGSPPPEDTSSCYLISIYIDGKFVKVCIEGTNEEIEEILNDLSEGQLEEILSEIFDEFFEEEAATPTPTPIDFFASPTAPLIPTSTPTPVPGQFNPTSSGSIEEDCEQWLAQGFGGTIIFHTVCIISPTPAP